MEILNLIRERETASEFIASQPDKEQLLRILNAGRLAPSAKNRQPWRFIAITETSIKEKLKDKCYGDERVLTSAAVILLCTTNLDYKMPNGQISYPMDLSFAASSMIFQAQYENLASALITTFQEEDIKDVISIPYSMKVPLILLVGKGVGSPPSPKKRFDPPRVFSFDHW